MGDIQFVATDYYLQGGYVPYTDWFNLARLSGYDIIPISEMDVTDASKCYIVTPFNGEWLEGWPGAKARIIHYDLEWRDKKEQPPGVAECWVGDRWYAEKIGARYVPIGSHEGLAIRDYTDAIDQSYDVALMCYRAPYRRENIINQMRELGLSIAPDGWGSSRTADLFCSKCMVAIHQWDAFPCVAPLRMCIAAAHRIPVISEAVADKGIFENLLATTSYETLAEVVKAAVDYPTTMLQQHGETLYQKLCVDYTFRQSIEAAV